VSVWWPIPVTRLLDRLSLSPQGWALNAYPMDSHRSGHFATHLFLNWRPHVILEVWVEPLDPHMAWLGWAGMARLIGYRSVPYLNQRFE
jgi:hypothetical protein